MEGDFEKSQCEKKKLSKFLNPNGRKYKRIEEGTTGSVL